jgi:hypothetical protein
LVRISLSMGLSIRPNGCAQRRWYRRLDYCRSIYSYSSHLNTTDAHVVALSEHPHIDVEIYEGASHLGEIGAGIGILPREFRIANYTLACAKILSGVWEIIQRLGLESELLKCTDSKPIEEPGTHVLMTSTDRHSQLAIYDPVPTFRFRKSDQHTGSSFYTLMMKGELKRFPFLLFTISYLPLPRNIHVLSSC